MVSKQRWLWAAGILMAAASLGTAQDSLHRPAVVPRTTFSPLPERMEGIWSASPYFPAAQESVAQAPLGYATTLNAPNVERGPVPAFAPAGPAMTDHSICTRLPDTCPECTRTKPSCWSRWRHSWRDCFLGYRDQYEAPPLGYYLYLHGHTQVANGDAARMVLYHYDFVDGSDQLNSRGKYQLAKIATLLPQIFNPVIIEASADAPGMDEARQVAVVHELSKGPFPVPTERVVIGRPIAVPLQGVEVERIYRNLLLNTEAQGVRGNGGGITAAGGAATGTTGSGVLAPMAIPGR